MKTFRGIPGFADRLRSLMRRRGYSIRQLAQLAGKAPGTIGKLLYQTRSPSLQTAAQLAQVLGVSVESLLPGVLRTETFPIKESVHGK